MHFSITLKDGTVAESTFGQEPLAFIMGDGTLIQGLEMALYGLKAGDRQHVTLRPQDAFGISNETNVYEMDKTEFAPDIKLEPGVIIGFATPSGDEVAGTILGVFDDKVKVDFNHPLAGHEITFEVEILGVEQDELTAH